MEHCLFLLLMRSTLKKQEAQRCDIYGALFVFNHLLLNHRANLNQTFFVDQIKTKDTRGPKVSKKVILFLYAEHVFFYLY